MHTPWQNNTAGAFLFHFSSFQIYEVLMAELEEDVTRRNCAKHLFRSNIKWIRLAHFQISNKVNKNNLINLINHELESSSSDNETESDNEPSNETDN